MTRRPQIAMLADGKRLHLQDGPIDLIIEATGDPADVELAYEAAVRRFAGLLDELCLELHALRQPASPGLCRLRGVVARRMYLAVEPHAGTTFITPMAAVAGAVADEILKAMCGAATLERAYVNNGGDIALHLSDGEEFVIGVLDRPDASGVVLPVRVRASQTARGIATSGRHGRSFSLGIADAVTVLSTTAALADAAATIIANAVDLPGHPAVTRHPACDIQPDSDLGARLVTRAVGHLSRQEIACALEAGRRMASDLMNRGLVEAAILRFSGETVVVGAIEAERRSGTRGALAPEAAHA